MAHGRPWYKRSATDFILGTIGMDLETRGAYSLIIDMLNDRDRPLPDDARFLAGFLGVSVRKWAVIRTTLLADPSKLYVNADGNLTNPRFEREREEREAEHQRSVEAGRKGGKKSAEQRASEPAADAAPQGELTLPKNEENEFSASKTARKSRENGVKTSRNIGENDTPPLKSNDISEPPPQPSRARKRPEARVEEEILPPPSSSDPSRARTPARPREARPDDDGDRQDDLLALTHDCMEAAGIAARAASRPALLTQSLEIVKGWQRAGIDVRGMAIAVIESATLQNDEPAHSLARFTAAIETRHTKAKLHQRRNGKPIASLAKAEFDFPDEAPSMKAFRQSLAERIGKARYAQWCSALRFELTDWQSEGDQALLLVKSGKVGIWTAGRVMEQHRAAILETAKAVLGAQQAWDR